MEIKVVLNVMIELVAIMALGYILTKKKMFDKEFSGKLSWLVVNISLPMLIINSVCDREDTPVEGGIAIYVIAGIVFYVIMPVLAYIFCKLIFVKKQNMGTYQFMLIFSNCSFMGYPVLAAAFGNEAIFLTSIFNMPFNLVAFSYGIYLLAKENKDGTGFDAKKLINPGIISSIAAIVIYAAGIRFPKVIVDGTGMLGDITTPISMLVLGISLAQVPVRELFNEIRIYPMTVIRLVVLPIITFLVLSIFTSDGMLLGIATMTAAMPVASMSVMLTNQYGGNEKLAAVGVFISTVCSVATIPLMLWLLFSR